MATSNWQDGEDGANGTNGSDGSSAYHDLYGIKETFKTTYPNMFFDDDSKKQITDLMQSDKKNSHGKVKFVLLESIGKCQIDVEVENALINEAFDFYSK
jgi:3-dehydroquinate synthase